MRDRVTKKISSHLPLHLASSDITADKILCVPQEDTVSDNLNVKGREVADPSVASVARVIGIKMLLSKQLLPDL